MLSERKQKILKAIVDDYIDTAEPVGSKTLVNKYPLSLSSATVRNVMAELENAGYLIRPHLSAGREPTDKAYREYVDNLIDIPEAVKSENLPCDLENSNTNELTAIVKKASEWITKTTGYTTVVSSPQLSHSKLLQMKMLMIEPGKVLVVLVLAMGQVKDKVINVPYELAEEELNTLASIVEKELAGKKVDEITWITVETVKKNINLPNSLLNQVLFEAYLAIKQAENFDTYIDGVHNLLTYPEFQDINKARYVFDTLSKEGLISGYLDVIENNLLTSTDKSSVIEDKKMPFIIRIGQEITLPGFEDCSFVSTTYMLEDKVRGHIGVIGPKRMKYGEVISKITFAKNWLGHQVK